MLRAKRREDILFKYFGKWIYVLQSYLMDEGIKRTKNTKSDFLKKLNYIS